MIRAQPKPLRNSHEKHELAALTAPLLTFNLGKKIERLRREEHWLKGGRISETLLKYSDRIVLI